MNSQEFDFEAEYLSDDEAEQALDALVLTMANAVAEDESRTAVSDPYRTQQIVYVYKAMKRLVRGTSAKVTYQLHEPFQSRGSVSVTGKNIDMKKVVWFVRSAELASNFEVYPKTDGTVCMTFPFHGLTRPIE